MTQMCSFYIDNIPIREMVRNPAMGGDFPSKPMSLYATIWDGSNWATLGGRYKVNYKYAPFVAEFADLVLHGCAVDPVDHLSTCDKHESDRYNSVAVREQRSAMEDFRKKYILYSYCYDRRRYPTPTPECSIDTREARRVYRSSGERFMDRRRHGKRHRRSAAGDTTL